MRSLTPEQRLVVLYFLTAPNSNAIGIYRCTPAMVASDTGLPIETVLEAIPALEAFLLFDHAADEVFVYDAAEREIGAELKPTDRRMSMVARQWAEVESEAIRNQVAEGRPGWLPEETDKQSEQDIAKHTIPYHTSPLVGLKPLKGLNGDVKTTTPTESPKTWDGKTADEWFVECWEACPKRPGNSKVAARTAWDARLKRIPPAVLLAKTQEWSAQMDREAREPDKIKMAATFYGPSFDPETNYGPVGVQRQEIMDECGVPVWHVRDPETGEWKPEAAA